MRTRQGRVPPSFSQIALSSPAPPGAALLLQDGLLEACAWDPPHLLLTSRPLLSRLPGVGGPCERILQCGEAHPTICSEQSSGEAPSQQKA